MMFALSASTSGLVQCGRFTSKTGDLPRGCAAFRATGAWLSGSLLYVTSRYWRRSSSSSQITSCARERSSQCKVSRAEAEAAIIDCKKNLSEVKSERRRTVSHYVLYTCFSTTTTWYLGSETRMNTTHNTWKIKAPPRFCT